MVFNSRGAWIAAVVVFFVMAGLALIPLMAVMPEVTEETGAAGSESAIAIAVLAIACGLVPAVVAYFVGAAVIGSRRRARVTTR